VIFLPPKRSWWYQVSSNWLRSQGYSSLLDIRHRSRQATGYYHREKKGRGFPYAKNTAEVNVGTHNVLKKGPGQQTGYIEVPFPLTRKGLSPYVIQLKRRYLLVKKEVGNGKADFNGGVNWRGIHFKAADRLCALYGG
jgi:hypothetical protein